MELLLFIVMYCSVLFDIQNRKCITSIVEPPKLRDRPLSEDQLKFAMYMKSFGNSVQDS